LSALVGVAGARLLAHASDEKALARAALLTSCAYAVELAGGAAAGGYLVGKWGPFGVGVRQAALAGLAAAAALALATWASFGPTIGLLFLALIAPPMAAFGGRAGVRGRA
jgi:hypothetical protein